MYRSLLYIALYLMAFLVLVIMMLVSSKISTACLLAILYNAAGNVCALLQKSNKNFNKLDDNRLLAFSKICFYTSILNLSLVTTLWFQDLSIVIMQTITLMLSNITFNIELNKKSNKIIQLMFPSLLLVFNYYIAVGDFANLIICLFSYVLSLYIIEANHIRWQNKLMYYELIHKR